MDILKNLSGVMTSETTVKFLLDKAQKNPGLLSKILGKPPEQVQKAIQQGQKILPDILKNVKDAKSGGAYLRNIGVDKSFIGKQYNKYSPYLSKIPGMDQNLANPIIDAISGQLPDSEQNEKTRKSNKIDKSRYPKI